MNLSLPGVMLLQICQYSKNLPGIVGDVRFHKITSHQVLILWSDVNIGTKYTPFVNRENRSVIFLVCFSRCLKTYEVQQAPLSSTAHRHFHRINDRDTIFNSFVYMPGSFWHIFTFQPLYPLKTLFRQDHLNLSETVSASGWFRIRAIDFWGRCGDFSEELQYIE